MFDGPVIVWGVAARDVRAGVRRCGVALRAVVDVLAVVVRGVAAVRDVAARDVVVDVRGVTVAVRAPVFSPRRCVTVVVARDVVVDVFADVRDVTVGVSPGCLDFDVASRTAASATPMPQQTAMAKSKIFFILCFI